MVVLLAQQFKKEGGKILLARRLKKTVACGGDEAAACGYVVEYGDEAGGVVDDAEQQRSKARLRTRRSNSAAAPMALAGDKICSLVRRRIKRRAVQRAAALRAHKNNMHPGQNAAPGGATAQPQRCALTKKTCTSHPLPKITPPFTRRSSMYILLSAHNPWFTPPSCTVSVYTVNSNSVPLSGSSAEHTL